MLHCLFLLVVAGYCLLSDVGILWVSVVLIGSSRSFWNLMHGVWDPRAGIVPVGSLRLFPFLMSWACTLMSHRMGYALFGVNVPVLCPFGLSGFPFDELKDLRVNAISRGHMGKNFRKTVLEPR